MRSDNNLSGKLLNVSDIKNTPLTPEEISVIVGSALGDSSFSVVPHCVNVALSTGHSPAQLEYLRWKVSLLNRLYHKTEPSPYTSKRYGTTLYKVNTMRHPGITELAKIALVNGKKTVTKTLLDKLTPIGLAIWFQDDGSYAANPHFATNGFSESENELIAAWLEERYGVTPNVLYNPARKTTWGKAKESWSLRFRKEPWLKLKTIIEPHIHPSLAYKIGQEALPAD